MVFVLFLLSSLSATSHPEWCRLRLVPAWFVDSALRWRRNGAGGLIRNSCLGCAALREPQSPGAEARRFSFRRAHPRRAGLRLARRKPMFSSVNCNYPSKSSGFYEFGLHSTLVDLRTNRTSFPSTYPCCRQLHIPVCCGAGNNSQFKIHNAQLRSSLSF